MKAVFASAYFAPISYYQKLNQFDECVLDVHEHMVKQSYRNRAVIYGANGALNLIVPLINRTNRTPIYQQRIEDSQEWKKLHLKSIESAYRSSPFYEYYIDELEQVLMKEYEFLVDLNLACHQFICDQLDEKWLFQKSDVFVEGDDFQNYRDTIHPKKESLYEGPEYYQVFSDKYGFLKDLSILDLLFNQGPNTLSYFY